MSIAAGHLDAIVHRSDRQTVTIELREMDRNLSVGFVEISLVPTGARVLGTHGKDDAEADGFLILHAEVPS